MKTKLLLLSSVIGIISCTIKEDRLPCPCLLRLDFEIAARYSSTYSVKGWGYGKSLFGESINPEDWPDGWTVRVPKGDVEYSACSSLTECVMNGNSVIVPEGKEFDKVWAGHRQLALSEEETMDRVIPHKQWAEVTIQMKNIPEGELVTEVTGNSIGFSLADLRPVEGLFRVSVPNEGKGLVSFSIPRQADDGLSLVLFCDGKPVKAYELGKMIAGTGYDWNSEDLDDIYLGMDYDKLEMNISIDPWHGGETYEVRSVSVVPFTDGMHPVRSSFSWTDSEINDIQLMAMDEAGNISMFYFPDFNGSADLQLMAGREYRIKAAANIGGRIGNEEMLGLFDGTWKPDRSKLASTGIPMTGTASTYVGTTDYQSIPITMTRMLARIDFSMDRSRLLQPGQLIVKSVRVFDGAEVQYDYASTADLRLLQSGGTISMYTYENMMGDLLPGNKDPWAKVPSKISADADKCSWLELKCSYDSGSRFSDDITYRVYLGKNATSNFDVQRNTVYSLTLIPSEGEIYGGRGSWKISSSGWRWLYTYQKKLEIINGGDLFVGDEATFEVKLYTDTYIDGRPYDIDRTGERIKGSQLLWGFGSSPAYRKTTSQYASISIDGTIKGLSPGQCTVICILPEDTSVYATKTINIHDTTDELGIDLYVQWGSGNYRIGFNY